MVVQPMYYRALLLDENGLPYTTLNPLAVDATLTGATVYTVPPNCITKEYTGDQTDIVLLACPGGKQIEAIGCIVTGQTGLFDLKIHFKTSNLTIQQHFVNGTLGTYIPLKVLGALNEGVTIDISGANPADKWFIVFNYALVP